MTSAAFMLVAVVNLAQTLPPIQAATTPAVGAQRVWKALEFDVQNPTNQRLRPVRVFAVGATTPGVLFRTCVKARMIQVDSSVDPKIILPEAVNTPKAHVRTVGEPVPVCSNPVRR